MERKRVIKAKEIAEDIVAGMTDLRLMAKYRLTSKGLEAVYRKLAELNLIPPRDFGGNKPEPADDHQDDLVLGPAEPLEDATIRISPREIIDFPLHCYDADAPHERGSIRDISEEGLGIKGIKCHPNELRSLVIPISELYMPEPVVVEGICRWAGNDEADGKPIAGFEVVKFIRGTLSEILDLIRSLSLEERALVCKRSQEERSKSI